MTSETLVKQIETCSNAIVAFAVLQGLAYSYAFGTNAFFNCLVKTSHYLAEGLTLLFAVVTLLAIAATMALGSALKRISGEFRSIVSNIYLGKVIAVTIFSLIPLAITIGYGVADYPNKAACKEITTAIRSSPRDAEDLSVGYTGYSALTPAASMTRSQRSNSLTSQVRNSAGVLPPSVTWSRW